MSQNPFKSFSVARILCIRNRVALRIARARAGTTEEVEANAQYLLLSEALAAK